MAFDLLGDCTALRKLYLGIQTDTLNTIDNKLCHLSNLRKTGVFDGLRDLPNLDLRVREIWYWSVDWGCSKAQSLAWDFHNKLPALDQFDFELGAQPILAHRRFPEKYSTEELMVFEVELKGDLARPKVEVKNEASTSTVQKSKILGARDLRSVKPFQSTRPTLFRDITGPRFGDGNSPARASSSRRLIWRP